MSTPTEEFEVRDAPRAASPAPRRRRRGPLPWAVGGAALTLAGVLVAPTGGLPPVLPAGEVGTLAVDLSVAPEPEWSTPVAGWDGADTSELQVVDDVLIVLGRDAVGLDLATGAELWRLDVDTTRCEVADALVCIDRTGQAPAVLRVDPRDGTFAWHEMTDAIAAVDLGEDLVIVRGDRHEQVLERMGPTGAVRWSRGMPDLADTGDPSWRSVVTLTVVADQVYVSGAESTTVDAETGAVLDTPFAWVERSWWGLVGGRDDGTYALLDETGGVLVDDLLTVPDDDPHGSVTVNRPRADDEDLVVTDGGAELWSAPPGWVAARVDGALVSIDWGAATTTGRDERSGAILWEATDTLSALTGGGRTVVLASSSGTAPLVGRDVRSGEVRWSVGAAVAAYPFALLPDGLCVIDDGSVVRLRWSLGRG